jgi:5-methylcytosine-specific restriction endonuclease McrA
MCEAIDRIDQKTCTKCGETKKTTEFRRRKLKDGTRVATSWCRSCLNDAAREGMRSQGQDPDVRAAKRQKDRERYARLKDDPEFRVAERARSKEYCARSEVKEATRLRVLEWTIANPEKANARARRWSAAHPDRVRESRRIYLQTHPTRRLKQKLVGYTRRWREYNQGDGFTFHQANLCALFWNYRCAYCGVFVVVKTGRAGRCGFDHVIPIARGGGHGPDNCVVCCPPCNYRKNKRALPEIVLDALGVQITAFLDLLPIEAAHDKGGQVPTAVRLACMAVEEKIRGLGVPVGTDW